MYVFERIWKRMLCAVEWFLKKIADLTSLLSVHLFEHNVIDPNLIVTIGANTTIAHTVSSIAWNSNIMSALKVNIDSKTHLRNFRE